MVGFPVVSDTLRADGKFTGYFDQISEIQSSMNNIRYPNQPKSTLVTQLFGTYKKLMSQYRKQYEDLSRQYKVLGHSMRDLKPEYNVDMYDSLPCLLVEFDANARTCAYVKSLNERGYCCAN